jgi:Spy/CpxP family protein refolding chaperone
MKILGILVLIATAAQAQQTPQPAKPATSVPSSDLSNQMRREIEARLAGIRAQAGLAVTQADLARIQAEIARSGRLPDNWWRNLAVVTTLRLTPAQVRQMEDIFQQHRLKLIDLNASLEKEEVTLEPLVAADTLDEAKLTAQIDRVAQARAELEKSRGRMLVGIRKVLEPEQWRKLSEMGFTVTSR